MLVLPRFWLLVTQMRIMGLFIWFPKMTRELPLIKKYVIHADPVGYIDQLLYLLISIIERYFNNHFPWHSII